MASDQPERVTDPGGPAAHELVLIVDPEALSSAANLLTDLPGPHSPTLTLPSAEAVGDAKLTREIREFHQRYREVAVALATDNDAAASHLEQAAAAYRRAEADLAARLAELNVALQAPNAPDTGNQDTDNYGGGEHDSGEQNNDQNKDDGDRKDAELYRI